MSEVTTLIGTACLLLPPSFLFPFFLTPHTPPLPSGPSGDTFQTWSQGPHVAWVLGSASSVISHLLDATDVSAAQSSLDLGPYA